MKAKDVLANNGDPAEAIVHNMGNAIHARKMRDGKISVDALFGVKAEAQMWADAYVRRGKAQGKDMSGVRSKLGKVIDTLHQTWVERAIPLTLKDYKRGGAIA